MSLIICAECGKMFSDKALACPICACPTEYILNLNKNTKQENDEKDFDTNISRDFIIEADVVAKYTGDGEYIKVPDGIRRIAKAAFRCCRSIKSIVLPQSVEHIDEQAFEDCLNLKEINIPPLVKNISVHTFRNCQALTSIFLPEGLKTIAAYAFSRCYNLDRFYLPSTIIYISKFAFSGCDSHNKIYYN